MDQPWKIALFRGLLTAVLVGATGTLAMWQETDSAKLLAIAGLTPLITVLLARFGVEGTWDQRNR